MAAKDRFEDLACWPEAEAKLKLGLAVTTVAAWMQEEAEALPELSRTALVKALYRVRDEMPLTDLAKVAPTWLQTKLATARRGVNELEELEKLYLLQMARISTGMEFEERAKFLKKDMWRDLQLGKDLLTAMAELKMELGVYARSDRNVNLIPGDTSATHFGQALSEMDPDRRRKVTAVAQKMFEVMQASALAVEAVEILPALSAGQEVQPALALPSPDPTTDPSLLR